MASLEESYRKLNELKERRAAERDLNNTAQLLVLKSRGQTAGDADTILAEPRHLAPQQRQQVAILAPLRRCFGAWMGRQRQLAAHAVLAGLEEQGPPVRLAALLLDRRYGRRLEARPRAGCSDAGQTGRPLRYCFRVGRAASGRAILRPPARGSLGLHPDGDAHDSDDPNRRTVRGNRPVHEPDCGAGLQCGCSEAATARSPTGARRRQPPVGRCGRVRVLTRTG